MNLREFFLEQFAGDLEYHPRRAAIYVVLAAGAGCFWIFSAADVKFTTLPLVFALGSLTLMGKGIYLFRPSSEGISLTYRELADVTSSAKRKQLPTLPEQVAQVVQDFGTGGLLLWPLLNLGKDVDQTWTSPPRFNVFVVGAFLFGLGWVIRRFAERQGDQS